MDQATLTHDEVLHLVHLLLDGIDVLEHNMELPSTWTAQAWEFAEVLMDRLFPEH